MKGKTKDKLLLIYIIINLFYILIGSYITLNEYIDMKVFSYGYIVLLVINILIILIMFIKKKYKKNIIDIFLVLIIILAIISTIFAYMPEKALYGEWGRYEGLFVICYYMTILFLTSFLKKEDRKKVVYGILIFGFIQCMYAFAQKFNLFNVYTKFIKGYRCTTGFTQNRNFFGTLMLICNCYSIGLFIDSKKKLENIIYFILIIILSIGLYLSKSLACLVGLAFVMIILIIYVKKKKNLKKYFILIITLISVFLIIESTSLTTYFEDINTTKTEVKEIVKGNFNDEFGSGRIKLWKETFEIVPKYLLHGIGIDNFGNIKNGKPIRGLISYFDKAHNEYLQVLVTMGIFSLISYLCLHFIIIKNGIKNTFKDKEIYLILPVIGYLIQAQFNISVIEVAPLFYIGLGLLIDRDKVN